jgi:cholest-4-en-3-one 26-monooxygenase
MTAVDQTSAQAPSVSQQVAPSADPRPGDVDLSDPKTFVAGVPHAYFRMLREEAPVCWQDECKVPGLRQGSGYWALTRYEDVVRVSKDSATFSSERGTCLISDLPRRDLENMREQLINMDTPGHTELRNLMNPHFKPSTVQDTEEHTRRIVCETLDALEEQSECDFVDAVSAPISLRALTHFLGVPDKHSGRFYKWTNHMIGAGEPGAGSVRRARLVMLQIFLYAAFLARRRRRKPAGDVFSSLANGEFAGLPLKRMKLNMNFFLLLIAGNETTRNALSGGVQALCEHPEQFERLRRDPSLLPRAIEEMLRWATPVMQFRRTATRDTKVGDQAIRKGEKLVMYYGAANRDPRVFENPETFDITRKPNPHLAFGTGTHFCMGSHMARLEMRVTLEELLRRFPNLHLTGPPERLHSNFISGIKRMPMRLSTDH